MLQDWRNPPSPENRDQGKVFKEGGYENIGMSKRYVDQAIRDPPLYCGKESKVQKRTTPLIKLQSIILVSRQGSPR